MKKLLTLLALALAISLSNIAANAQAEEQSGMIKTAKGILVVWNEPGNYFTIEIKGEKISPGQQPMMFQVNGKRDHRIGIDRVGGYQT